MKRHTQGREESNRPGARRPPAAVDCHPQAAGDDRHAISGSLEAVARHCDRATTALNRLEDQSPDGRWVTYPGPAEHCEVVVARRRARQRAHICQQRPVAKLAAMHNHS